MTGAGSGWIVVVEPYYDGSHRAWADGYAAHSAHEVTLLTHGGSFWKWRMHGGALTLGRELDRLVETRGRHPDAVIVSDMVDLAAFAGVARRALGDARVIAYFHENQLTYPLAPGALPDLSYALKNWLSLAAADEIWFNSDHHRTEVARALPALLGSMPDHRHTPLIDEVMDRARVMPVGIDLPEDLGSPLDQLRATDPPLVLWNQRWEYDKDPARFFAAIDRAVGRGTGFVLAVAGQNFRVEPSEFAAARERHQSRIIHFGEADPATYRSLLDKAGVVVSTARHEFFGIAVAEAIAAGCVPVVPAALAYPELLGEDFGDLSYHDDDELDARLDEAVDACARGSNPWPDLTASVRARFGWPVVAEQYDRRIEVMLSC